MKISIIGGADTIDEYAYEANIVVRVNQHYIRQGGRCDVAFLSGSEVVRQIPTDCIPEVVFLYRHVSSINLRMIYGGNPKQNRLMKVLLKNKDFAKAQREEQYYNDFLKRCLQVKAKVNFFLHVPPDFENVPDVPDAWPYILAQQLGCLPLTGYLAIIKFAAHPHTTQVFVTGMNMYGGAERVGAHNLVAHRGALSSARDVLSRMHQGPFLIYDKVLAAEVESFEGSVPLRHSLVPEIENPSEHTPESLLCLSDSGPWTPKEEEPQT